MPDKFFYAQDPVNVRTMARELGDVLAASRHLNWYALVDSAFDFREQKSCPFSALGVNCFDFREFQGIEAAGPLLLPIGRSGEVLLELLRHCQNRPMLSFIATSLNAQELKEHFRPIHWVFSEDGQRFLLRIADIRVLSRIPQVFSRNRWLGICDVVEHWLFVTRTGQLGSLPVGPKSTPGSEISLRLSADEFANLLAAAEPESIVGLIWESMPEIVPNGLRASEVFSSVSQAHSVGNEYGLAFSEIVSLAVAQFLSPHPMLEMPALHQFLRGRQWQGEDFGSLLLGFIDPSMISTVQK